MSTNWDELNKHFNCLPGEPDWATFESLEINAVSILYDEETGAEIGCETTEDLASADFWTVYGRRANGLAQAITDCKDEMTAVVYAALYATKLANAHKPTKYVALTPTACTGLILSWWDDQTPVLFDTAAEAAEDAEPLDRIAPVYVSHGSLYTIGGVGTRTLTELRQQAGR